MLYLCCICLGAPAGKYYFWENFIFIEKMLGILLIYKITF
jgi:hypothetical protein